MAMVGCGEYKSLDEAVDKLIKIKDSILPNESLVEMYNKKYNVFKQIYPALKDIYSQI